MKKTTDKMGFRHTKNVKSADCSAKIVKPKKTPKLKKGGKLNVK